MFFMLYVRNNEWMNEKYRPTIPDGTWPTSSWINDRESREFFARLVRDMGHGYAHANAGKPINWYKHMVYSSDRCQDWLDPLQNYFSMHNMGRGYDADGVFGYDQGDMLTNVEFKFHAIGYNGGWMVPPIWEYYIQRDGTLRYHFRDFIDYLGDQLPSGSITIFELFNEIMDCNSFNNPSGFLEDGIRCTKSIHHNEYVNSPSDNPAGRLSNAAECPDMLLTTDKWDYFEVLALPSERAAGVTKENKAQIWCELALRARAKWGFPAAAYNDYDISPDNGGGRAQWALDVVRRIAGTTLTDEQKQSLVGLYDDVNSLQCIDAIDVIGMQSHYGINNINNGRTYTATAINDYIEDRIATVQTMATALKSVGYDKILEVHFTEIDFTNAHSNPYVYTIDASTRVTSADADGRSTYQDDPNSEEYSKFYAFAHAIFTSCWATKYCTMLANWGTWDAWRWGPLDDANGNPVWNTDHFTLFDLNKKPTAAFYALADSIAGRKHQDCGQDLSARPSLQAHCDSDSYTMVTAFKATPPPSPIPSPPSPPHPPPQVPDPLPPFSPPTIPPLPPISDWTCYPSPNSDTLYANYYTVVSSPITYTSTDVSNLFDTQLTSGLYNGTNYGHYCSEVSGAGVKPKLTITPNTGQTEMINKFSSAGITMIVRNIDTTGQESATQKYLTPFSVYTGTAASPYTNKCIGGSEVSDGGTDAGRHVVVCPYDVATANTITIERDLPGVNLCIGELYICASSEVPPSAPQPPSLPPSPPLEPTPRPPPGSPPPPAPPGGPPPASQLWCVPFTYTGTSAGSTAYVDLAGFWTYAHDTSFTVNNQWDNDLSTMACTADVAGTIGDSAYFWYKFGPNDDPDDNRGKVFLPSGSLSVYISNSNGGGTSTGADFVPFRAFVSTGAGGFGRTVVDCTYAPSDVPLLSAANGQEYLLHCPVDVAGNNHLTIASATAGRRMCIGEIKFCMDNPPSPPILPPSSPPATDPKLPPSAPSPALPPPVSPPPTVPCITQSARLNVSLSVWSDTRDTGVQEGTNSVLYSGDMLVQTDSGPFYLPWYLHKPSWGGLVGNPSWTPSHSDTATTNAVLKVDWLAGGETIAVGNGVVTTQQEWNTEYGNDRKEAALVYNDITCLYPVLTAKQGPEVCSSFGDGQACTVLNSDRRVARYQFEIGTGTLPGITGVSPDTIFVSVHDIATRIRGDDTFDKRYVIAPGASSVHADSSKVLTGSTGGGAPYWAEPTTDDDPVGGFDFTHPYETPHVEHIVTFRFDNTNSFELLTGFANTAPTAGTVSDVGAMCITVRRDLDLVGGGHAPLCVISPSEPPPPPLPPFVPPLLPPSSPQILWSSFNRKPKSPPLPALPPPSPPPPSPPPPTPASPPPAFPLGQCQNIDLDTTTATFDDGSTSLSTSGNNIDSTWNLNGVKMTYPGESTPAAETVTMSIELQAAAAEHDIGASKVTAERIEPSQSQYALQYADGNIICLYSTLTSPDSSTCDSPLTQACTIPMAEYKITLQGAPAGRYYFSWLDNDAHEYGGTFLRKWGAVYEATDVFLGSSTSLARMDTGAQQWKAAYQVNDANIGFQLTPNYQEAIDMMFAIDSATPNPSFHVARGFMRSSGTSLSGNQYSDNRCFTLTKHPAIAGTPCPSPPPTPPALPVVAALRGCDEFYRRTDEYEAAKTGVSNGGYVSPGTMPTQLWSSSQSDCSSCRAYEGLGVDVAGALTCSGTPSQNGCWIPSRHYPRSKCNSSFYFAHSSNTADGRYADKSWQLHWWRENGRASNPCINNFCNVNGASGYTGDNPCAECAGICVAGFRLNSDPDSTTLAEEAGAVPTVSTSQDNIFLSVDSLDELGNIRYGDHTVAEAQALTTGNGIHVLNNGGEMCDSRDTPSGRSILVAVQPTSAALRLSMPVQYVTPCCTRINVNATGEYSQMSGFYTMADYVNGRPTYQRVTGTAIPLPVQAKYGYDLLQFTRRCGSATGSTLNRPGGGLPYPRFEAGLGLGVSVGQKLAGLRPFNDLLDVVTDGNLSFVAAMTDWHGMKNDTVSQVGMERYETPSDLIEDWEQENVFCDRMNLVQAGLSRFFYGASVERTVPGPQYESCDESVRCAEEIESKCSRVAVADAYGSMSFTCASV